MMKMTIALAFWATMGLGFAHGQQVPEAARKDFAGRFPGATGTRWEKEGGLFEAEFKEGGQSASAEYDLKGNWIATEREIEEADLPVALKEAVAAKYPGATLVEAETVQKGSDAVKFEVVIKHGGKKVELLSDGSGAIHPASHGGGSDSDD
jgi:hypothetical protein